MSSEDIYLRRRSSFGMRTDVVFDDRLSVTAVTVLLTALALEAMDRPLSDVLQLVMERGVSEAEALAALAELESAGYWWEFRRADGVTVTVISDVPVGELEAVDGLAESFPDGLLDCTNTGQAWLIEAGSARAVGV